MKLHRHLSMRSIMLVLAASIGFLFFVVESVTGEIYKWRDETGKLHIVDDIKRVPPQYRNQSEGEKKTPLGSVAPPKEQTDAAADLPTTEGNYTVTVGSFRQKDRADRYVEKLKKQGLKAFRWEVDLPDKGRWHRVCIGSYPTPVQAKIFAADLEQEGFKPFVTRFSAGQ